MVLKLVFDFVLCKEKLQPALVAVIYIPLLKGEKEKDSNKPLPLECSSEETGQCQAQRPSRPSTDDLRNTQQQNYPRESSPPILPEKGGLGPQTISS